MTDINRIKIYKTISYRLVSSAVGFFVIFMFSGSAKAGAMFGLGELLLKPLMYYLHERCWIPAERKSINKTVVNPKH